MPHKRNPVLSENLTGLARIIRAAVMPALENVTLWHERDISHSSVERVMAPAACVALDFALSRMASVINHLQIYPDAMKENLERTGGLVFSQRVLLALTQAGVSREDAYAIVQRNAMKVWDSRGRKQFLDVLKKDAAVTKALSAKQLKAIFDAKYYIRHSNAILKRAFS